MAQKKKPGKKSQAANFGDAVLNDMLDWCQGRSALVRLPLLLLFGYVLIQHLQDPLYSDFFKPLNLTIHELGHYVFAPSGQFMHIAGGSLFQCLIPLAVGIPMFFRQRDYFAIAIAFGWFSTNLFDVATYAADARSQELPLVSPGMAGNAEEIIHDWHWLLETTNLLPYDHNIAQFLRFLAFCSTLVCLLMGGALCFIMFKSKWKKKEVVGGESELT
ncbi:MAG: hypothetical protein K2W95_04555 [Candidatus Obscuribacterales bacterium]|nr:hypothetical protein [Candidatus Obscuribacterales bacterium]